MLTLLTTVFLSLGANATGGNDLKIDFYQHRYPLKDVFQKQVDNHGDGDERLYGVRNFRAVLNGVLYRGGANNRYNKYGARDNQNPLPNIGLKNLCDEGFSKAFYLYSTNFQTAPPVTTCNSVNGQNRFQYFQRNPFSEAGIKEMFAAVKQVIDSDGGPIYLHCWNGWHASGLASALALRQFCGASASAAVSYWDKNTDGNNSDPGFETIRNRIRAFVPWAEFKISPEVRERICPSL